MATAITDVEASVSFVAHFLEQYGNDHVPFQTCSLREAISEACFAPLEARKLIALYFHNEAAPFSKVLCPALVKGEVRTFLESKYIFLGWDVGNEQYHSALRLSLSDNLDFEPAWELIQQKHAALLILYPIENSITIFSLLHGNKTSVKDVKYALQQIDESFQAEINDEIELNAVKKKTEKDNDITSREFHQLMYDRLGDRDYDCFEYDEHNYLKDKIGFAKFGPPQSDKGYDKKQNKSIEETCKQICTNNNMYAEWHDQVIVSFVYNCLEPLPKEKIERAKKYSDYNPGTDIVPTPIFVIRKCRGSKNPCRIFIDDTNRVYASWVEYIENNKLYKCTMVLPKDGRYDGDKNGQVLLEKHLSPSCGIGYAVLQGVDIVSTVAGIASGGVFIAAMIPAITVAPVALTAAAVTGIGVGIYSVIRSAINIHDRHRHQESLSFANSDARGAYLNIVAGSLGFAGAGATAAVSQLATRGVNIGQGARVVVNTIGVINIGASGVSVANSTYHVIDDWINEQRTPSLLTVIQLSSSILFFGNAVYNFKSAETIIEESQATVMKDYQDSLRSNRHRKTFDKMLKETIRQNNGDVGTGQAEVISTIRRIPNKNEVFAVLTRNNKMFNKEGIRFAAQNGEIQLNGVPVDLLEFGTLSQNERMQILTDLPKRPSTNDAVTTTRINNLMKSVFNNYNINTTMQIGHLVCNGSSFVNLVAQLLQDYSELTQKRVLEICKLLIIKLSATIEDIGYIFKKYFSQIDNDPFYLILRFVLNFVKTKLNSYEQQYEEEKNMAMQSPFYNEDEFNKKWNIFSNVANRAVFWFEQIVDIFFEDSIIVEARLMELTKYVMNVIIQQTYDYCNTEEKRKKREKNTTRNMYKIDCKICGGYYYSTNNS